VLRPTRIMLLTLAAGAALAGCGGDEGEAGATRAVPGPDYPASQVCDQLPVDAVASVLPGAVVDRSLPTPESCFYAADAGDVILTAMTPPRGQGSPTPEILHDIALSDATQNGAGDVRAAPSLGDDGQVAINAADAEITAVWRRGDAVYSLQYSGWDGPADDAVGVSRRLAAAVRSGT
jgi:hypothetical protein